MPLIFRLIGRVRERKTHLPGGRYDLGWTLGTVFNVFGVLYRAFATITFNFPSVNPIDSNNMNYSSAAVGVCIIISVITWLTKRIESE